MTPSWNLPFQERIECAAVYATAADARSVIREMGLEGEDAWYFWIDHIEDELPKYIEAFRRTI